MQPASASSSLPLTLPNFNLASMEKTLVIEALRTAGTIAGAAELLGINRQKMKRYIIKHQIQYPRE